MPAQPLRPLIYGMFAMLLVWGMVGLFITLYQAVEDQQQLAQQQKIRNEQAFEEMKLRHAEATKRVRVQRTDPPTPPPQTSFDVQVAFTRLEASAARGDPNAQYSLGAIYEIGIKPEFFNRDRPAAWILGRPGWILFGESPRQLLNSAHFVNLPSLPSNERLAGVWFRVQAHR